MSRRAFVGGLSLLGGASLCRADLLGLFDSDDKFSALPGQQSFKAVRGPALYTTSAHRLIKTAGPTWDPKMPGAMKILSFETGEVITIPSNVMTHVYDQHPVRSNIFVGPSKHAIHVSVIDTEKRETVTTLRAPEHSQFYGHSAFEPSGKRVFFTSHNGAKDVGEICIFDCESWKMLGVSPSGGGLPHDCFRTASGHLLVVNERAPKTGSTLSLLRASDLKIEQNWPIPPAAHLLSMGADRVVLCGVRDQNPTSIMSLDLKTGKYTTYQQALEASGLNFIGEALSLAKLSDVEVGITIPQATKVIVWNLKTNKLSVISSEFTVHGIIEHNGDVYVNDASFQLHRFPLNKMVSKLEIPQMPEFANGRHLRIFST